MSTRVLAVLVLMQILITGCGSGNRRTPPAPRASAGTDAPATAPAGSAPAAGKGRRTGGGRDGSTLAAAPREREPELPMPAASTPSPKRARQGGTDNRDARADRVIEIGRQCLGAPYKFGAPPSMAPRMFDCSSFAQYVFGKVGVTLPRTSTEQATTGHKVHGKPAKADLVFFHIPSRDQPIGHVAIAMGDGRILQAVSAGVSCDELQGTWRDLWLDDKTRREF